MKAEITDLRVTIKCQLCDRNCFIPRTRQAGLCSSCLDKKGRAERKKELFSCSDCGSQNTRRYMQEEPGNKIYCKKCVVKIVREEIKRDKRTTDWRYSKYGIEKDDYHMMLVSQSYRCQICLEAFIYEGKKNVHRNKAVIDHNHLTGRVRGLLCNSCNLLISKLDWPGDEAKLFRAIEYLKKGNK